jgi:hypothetical protein
VLKYFCGVAVCFVSSLKKKRATLATSGGTWEFGAPNGTDLENFEIVSVVFEMILILFK